MTEVLLTAMRGDPRWDWQVEDRTPLWTEVAVLTGLDPQHLIEIAEDLDGERYPDASSSAAVAVLAGMAARGGRRAHAALLDVVLEGRNWADAVWELVEADLDGDLGERLAKRLHDDAAAREVLTGQHSYPAIWDLEPWTAWREQYSVMNRLALDYEARRPAPQEEPPEAHPGMSVVELLASDDVVGAAEVLAGLDPPRELLRKTASGPEPLPAAVAYRTLAELGDDSVIKAAARVLAGPHVRGLTRAAQHYIRLSPGDATLAYARAWVDSDDSALVRTGWWILAEQATTDDVPRLQAAIEPALRSDDMYRLCNALEGLARVPGVALSPGVARAFREAPYAYARRDAAAALAAHDAAFGRTLAIECLWDSDRGVRRIGAAVADSTVPWVVDRLAAVARDLEDRG